MRLACALLLLSTTLLADEPPKVLDPRLKLEFIAEAPVIRTPTGIAIDDKGRVYVIESHTHFRPNDYDGPKADRILRFTEKDGKWEPTVFFEGTTHTMGLGFHPDGSLFVATRMEIFKLQDKNNDDQIAEDERINLIKHETPGSYPHNGLSGFAFDFAGNVYFGQGENLGAAYKVIGSDGTTISGGGEGGNIYSCKADGSKLRRVATGFWNPFHMYMDPFGRLFAVDNDPDSRPPCRLIHVVEGGDYGYRFRNGRKGLHPFTSWNGELPGTLPMVAGTGEAPSGIVGELDLLLPDSPNDLLVTSWGDHRIEKYHLRKRGASFESQMESLISGGENFRPVGIVEHPDGSVWFSDWVDKSYQLHSKGRLWRVSRITNESANILAHRQHAAQVRKFTDADDALLSAKLQTALVSKWVSPDVVAEVIGKLGYKKTMQARIKLLEYAPRDELKAVALGGSIGETAPFPEAFDSTWFTGSEHASQIRYAATRRLDPDKHLLRLRELTGDPDPFIQQAARTALLPVADSLWAVPDVQEATPAIRLGVALVLRQANTEATRKWIPHLLKDSDPHVRFVAIQWMGEERLTDLWSSVKDEVEKRATTRQELEAFFATSALLSSEKYDPGKESRGEDFIAKMLTDAKTSPERQAFLLRMLRADHPAITEALLQKWFEGKDADLRLAALQVISQRGTPPKFLNVGELAQDASKPVEERVEAIALASPMNPNYVPMLEKLSKDSSSLIASQAQRTLRTDEKSAASIALASSRESRPQLADVSAWKDLLAKQPGDAKSGSLVFNHAIVGCNKCHEVAGRGAAIGPNLTSIGKQISRERLLHSILQPSKEIAPQFALWEIETKDGRVQKGMYFDEEVDGTVIYADEQGRKFKVHPRDVESRTQQQKSIMPDGLAYRLTEQELRDLLAFLGSE